MGCSSSREIDAPSAGEGGALPAASNSRLATNTRPQIPVSQTPLNQSSNQIHSTTTSRVALNPASATSLPSVSGIPSPTASSNRHRHRSTADGTESNLSDHYNLPLQRPRPWKSQSRAWSRSQLHRERRDFFDTRVTGHREVWEALRQITECVRERDTTTAQGILDAVNITLPTGYLEDGCYDERGFLYRIPEEVLTDPINLQPDEPEVDGETVVGVPAETKAKLNGDILVEKEGSSPQTILETQSVPIIDREKETVPEDATQLKCRLSDRGSDIHTYISKTETVSVLANRLKNLAQIPAYARIEVFYLGKKLDQKKTLAEQDHMEKHVLNIFVVGAPK